MSEQNTVNAATTGSNDDANQAIDDQSNRVDTSSRMDVSDSDDASMNNSFNGNHGNGDKQSNADSSMRTIDEEKPSKFDKLGDDEIIAMMNNHIEEVQHEEKNDDNVHHNEDFGVAYSGDTAMMESNPNGSSVNHYYDGHNDQDYDNASAASQGASEGGDSNYSDGTFHGNNNGNMRMDSSSPSDAAASWFKAKNTASKTSTPQASNTTNDEEGREQARKVKVGHKASGGLEELQAASAESTQIMKDISSKLDEKLDSTRLLTKRLLEEMTVYVQSLQIVVSEYQRIRKFELRESQRLDAVEPEVNGASGMLLGGESGEFIGSIIEQQKQEKPPSTESHHRRHSLPNEEQRPMRPHRDRPLTPIIGNRRRSKIDRDGKENHASHRRSFG